MSRNSILAKCPPSYVFDTLSDGWLYGSWVVGAARVRAVDPEWPAVGSKIYHSVGTWPMMIDDTTSVTRMVPNELLVLRARLWPLGEADVVIEIQPAPGGCQVTISEDAVEGPGKFVPGFVRQPLLKARNTETLKRLALIAEGKSKGE